METDEQFWEEVGEGDKVTATVTGTVVAVGFDRKHLWLRTEQGVEIAVPKGKVSAKREETK